MISAIQQQPEAASQFRPARRVAPSAPSGPTPLDVGRVYPPAGPRPANGELAALFERRPREVLRTGFGEGTVSPPTVVARTLNGGLESAGRVVPSAQEVLDELRVSRSAERETQAREVEERRAERPDRAVASPVDQARGFINALNQTAATAQARLAGEAPPETEARASIRINGQALEFLRAQEDPRQTATARLDLLV